MKMKIYSISYTKGLSKTRNKGLNFKSRLISPKMHENKAERGPVTFFLLFKSKRLVDCEIWVPFTLLLLMLL